MITCDLRGGLGNQLFQIATAYTMAKKTSQPSTTAAAPIKPTTLSLTNLKCIPLDLDSYDSSGNINFDTELWIEDGIISLK
jgi:hypothetical protein